MKNLAILIFLCNSFTIVAQSPGDVVQSFGSSYGFNNTVNAIVVQPDGKLIIGGEMSSYQGFVQSNIFRLNTDGSFDNSFNTNNIIGGTVYAVAIQTDGKILVGGLFGVNRIIRLNINGSIDNTFNTGSGFASSQVQSIVLQPNGKIIVTGFFTSFNGAPANNIVRLNANGTQDTSFGNGTDINQAVLATALQSDGKIIIYGETFSNATGVSTVTGRLIRLNSDGFVSDNFAFGTNLSGQVFSILIQPDGKILVAGAFNSQTTGLTENKIIRFNTNGTKDTTFSAGLVANSGTLIRSMFLQPDGKIVIGGLISQTNGDFNHILRLNTNGGIDNSFQSPVSLDGIVTSMARQSDGKIVSGGSFTVFNGITKNRILRLNANGGNDTSFKTGDGFNNEVNAVIQQNDGKIVVAGNFDLYKEVNENRIVRLNTNGTKDNTFVTGSGFNNTVFSMATQADGKLLVGGQFTSYNGVTENRIVRLNENGSKDTSFVTGTGFNINVKSIVLQPDGKILIGGLFTSYNGVSESCIIRLNSNGTKDTTFNVGTGFNNSTNTIVLQSDGKILIGGQFFTFNGMAANYIIRLNANGTRDNSFSTGGFSNGTDAVAVNAIAVQNDGKLIVGGNFIFYNGSIENRLIRLNSNGTKDTSFLTGTGISGSSTNRNIISAITLQSDGKILVGGFFFAYNGLQELGLIRLNSNGTKDNSFLTGFNGPVNYISNILNNKFFVGGFFDNYKGISSSANLIALHSGTILSNIEFKNQDTFSLLPNPAKNILNVKASTDILAVKIFDLQGKLVIESAEKSIDVHSLLRGLYLAKIITINGASTKKFFKD